MDETLEALLKPVTEEAPGGELLEYDPAFVALEQEMKGTPEQQYGDVIIPAKPPDWARVAAESAELLQRSKDFRLAVAHARALVHGQGLVGAAVGAELVLALARDFWTSGFPELAFDGEPDLLPRSNAIAALASRDGLLGDLRAEKLGGTPLGAPAIGFLERIATGRLGADEEAVVSREDLPQWLHDQAAAGNEELHALERLHHAVVALDAFCAERFDQELAPDLAPLRQLLEIFSAPVAEGRAASAQADGAVDAPGAAPSGEGEPGALAAVAAGGYSRESVVQTLDAVCAYLRRAEPSNPAYLLIRRARNMIGKDFMAILEELAPDGLESARKITGNDP